MLKFVPSNQNFSILVSKLRKFTKKQFFKYGEGLEECESHLSKIINLTFGRWVVLSTKSWLQGWGGKKLNIPSPHIRKGQIFPFPPTAMSKNLNLPNDKKELCPLVVCYFHSGVLTMSSGFFFRGTLCRLSGNLPRSLTTSLWKGKKLTQIWPWRDASLGRARRETDQWCCCWVGLLPNRSISVSSLRFIWTADAMSCWST